MRALCVFLALVLASVAVAADRHVYLNSTGGGTQLNDCPNPVHNVKGTSNTDELVRCTDVTPNQFYCTGGGCQSWTRDCTAPNRANVVNGDIVDVDGDGTGEVVYATPQACAYAMAKSDTCEIHSGSYATAGAQSTTAGVLPTNTVDRSDGWLASVVMFGYGPNMGTTGYGTAANPAYVRGASMAGSVDSWDSNSNKIPDSVEGTCSAGTFSGYSCTVGGSECTGGSCTSASITGYPVVFDGNFDGDGSLNEATTCPTDGSNCAQDGFYAFIVGCGNVSTDGGNCLANLSGGQTRPKVDSDGNGSFDADANSGGPRNVSYVTIKDIEFKNYNGGASICSGNGIREALGHFTLAGGGTTSGNGDGLLIDHIYWHDDTYSNLCVQEHYVSVLGDDENWACSSATQTFTVGGITVTAPGTGLINSFIRTKNRSVINDDCDATQPGASECGCSKYVMGNRILLENTTAGQYQNVMRWKSINTVSAGTRPKKLVFTNNEIDINRADSGGSTYIFTPECTGLCDPYHVASGANGVIQFNGNIVRYQGSGTPAIHRFSESFCGDTFKFCEDNTTPCSCSSACATTPNSACAGIVGGFCNGTSVSAGVDWTYRSFLNTFDLDKFSGGGNTALDYLCNTNGLLAVQHHNAYFGVSTVHTEAATTTRRNTTPVGNDVCSASSQTSCTTDATGRTGWWTTGTQNAPLFGGLSNYIPKSGGPLSEKTSACDPDGDGTLGVDYYGEGSQRTTWADIAGNKVVCNTTDNPTGLLSFGAIQPNSDTPSAPATGAQRKRRVTPW